MEGEFDRGKGGFARESGGVLPCGGWGGGGFAGGRGVHGNFLPRGGGTAASCYLKRQSS